MAVEYKSIEFRLYEYLVQIQDMLTLLEADEDMLSKIVKTKELIRTKKYYVAVMGEFKRGKSSLINALLGQKILPADVEPATATINRITYGTALKAVVDFKDGTSRDLDISELSDYVTKLTPEGASRAALIKEAIVYAPTVICQNHVDIIDTPGLNDNEEMTKITIDTLNNVDAVIVAIHARAPFSETERNFVCQLIKGDKINNIVFVVTFIDQIDEDDYTYEEFMDKIKNRIQKEVFQKLSKDDEPESIVKKAHDIMDNMHIYGVSATQALKYFMTNDKKAFEKSRFDIFKAELLQSVTAKQVESSVQNAVKDIKEVLSELDNQFKAKMKKFDEELLFIQTDASNIYNYCDSAGRSLSRLFGNKFIKIDSITNSVYACKNLLVKNFIKGLSSLRSDKHRDIEYLLTTVSSEQYDIMNKEYLPPIKKELSELFDNIFMEFYGIRQGALTDSLSKFVSEEFNLFNLIDNAIIFKNEKLDEAHFLWHISPIPNVRNLAKCNVIDNITQAVDVSVDKYVSDLRQYIDLSREFLFTSINNDSQHMKSLVSMSENALKRSVDIRKEVYINNYETFSEKAKDIINKSQLILCEFYMK